MNETINISLVKVLREFGVVGVTTYIGGIILLTGFIWEQNFQRQVMLGIVGIILISLSVFIAYFRLRIQKDREKALIEMAQNTGNRLAEQLGKNLSKEQVVSITQTIWQNQKDLITAIVGKVKDKSA
ncbi:MAG: hypothetical protein Q8P80_05685 [Candidatus Levybacteria bacterium]|nr:hypothetical protein [Candidatus Levybacteria bacterium]